MYTRKIKKNKNLVQDGYQMIVVPKKILGIIEQDIKNNLLKKINFKTNIKKKNLSLLEQHIKKLPDKIFLSLFGDITERFISDKASRQFNLWIRKIMPKILKSKRVSMHYLRKFELKKNPKLKVNQFNFYFRCVRKNKRSDVGFVHRDSDFWDVGVEPRVPFKYKERWKLWLPIFGCTKQNSLKLSKKSHLSATTKIKYIKVGGKVKATIHPTLIKQFKKRIVQPFTNINKQALLFHDRHVHFAPTNKTSNLRISAECTIICL
jgi:hypothetical protein